MSLGSNLGEIWSFLKVRKKWWLLPIIVFSLLMSLFLVLAASTPASPFIYTLF